MKLSMTTGEPIRILLVEDNLDHAEMVRRSFEDNQVTNIIDHVTDGAEALDYLHRRGEYVDTRKYTRPHVVLLDLRIPKIDGLEVLDEIKSSENLKSIPVVVLTTSAADQDVANAYRHHANSYLVKPIDLRNFTEMIDELGDYWLAWNHKPF